MSKTCVYQKTSGLFCIYAGTIFRRSLLKFVHFIDFSIRYFRFFYLNNPNKYALQMKYTYIGQKIKILSFNLFLPELFYYLWITQNI